MHRCLGLGTVGVQVVYDWRSIVCVWGGGDLDGAGGVIGVEECTVSGNRGLRAIRVQWVCGVWR